MTHIKRKETPIIHKIATKLVDVQYSSQTDNPTIERKIAPQTHVKHQNVDFGSYATDFIVIAGPKEIQLSKNRRLFL